MTTESTERITRLEVRVDKLEESIAKHLQRIFEALEELKVGAVKHACPKPGACIGLGKELEHVLAAHNSTMLRVERLELKLIDSERLAITESRKIEREFSKLETQKAWVIGAWSVVAFLAAIVGAAIPLVINFYLKKP